MHWNLEENNSFTRDTRAPPTQSAIDGGDRDIEEQERCEHPDK